MQIGHFRNLIKKSYIKIWMKIIKSETFLLKSILLHLLKLKNIDPNSKIDNEVDKLQKDLSDAIDEKKVFIKSTVLLPKLEEMTFSFQEKVNSTKKKIIGEEK